MALDRRLGSALPHSCGDLRASTATQSFVPFNSFYFCNNPCCPDGGSTFRNFTSSSQNAAYAGGR